MNCVSRIETRLEGVRTARAERGRRPPGGSALGHLLELPRGSGHLCLTLDTLSTLRDEEMPRRIAFVSDKVFEPRWWQRVFNPTFAAGVLVAAAIRSTALMRTSQSQVDAAVAKAVSQVEAHDMQEIQAAYEQLDVRDKQVANLYRNAMLSQ